MQYKVASKLSLESLEAFINGWAIQEGWKLHSVTHAQLNYVTVVLEKERKYES